MFIRLFLLCSALSLTLAAFPANAEPPHKGQKDSAGKVIVKTVFDEVEKAIIEEYFGKNKI